MRVCILHMRKVTVCANKFTPNQQCQIHSVTQWRAWLQSFTHTQTSEDSPAERAASDVGPAREGSQKKPCESKRPEFATLVRLLYSPMNTGIVAKDGRHPADKLDICNPCKMWNFRVPSRCAPLIVEHEWEYCLQHNLLRKLAILGNS